MSELLHIVPRGTGMDDHGNGTGDVATWLRSIADLIEAGDFGTVGAGVVVLREDGQGETGSAFCLRTRRCNMTFVEQYGTLHLMAHDMKTGV